MKENREQGRIHHMSYLAKLLVERGADINVKDIDGSKICHLLRSTIDLKS